MGWLSKVGVAAGVASLAMGNSALLACSIAVGSAAIDYVFVSGTQLSSAKTPAPPLALHTAHELIFVGTGGKPSGDFGDESMAAVDDFAVTEIGPEVDLVSLIRVRAFSCIYWDMIDTHAHVCTR